MKSAVSGLPPQKLRDFRRILLAWYDESRRDLPWRETRDPYRIWVSEIMLQQTRVAAVAGYYRRFLDRFPNLVALANAKEADVLAAWSGLGYYRRARAMLAAAKIVVNEFSGKLPETSEGLKKLPGVGRYTAAAIGSIAFGQPDAVVDGNVARVLSRILGSELRDRNEAWPHAERLLDRKRPGDWNQAVMELGATVCLSAQPKCLACPVQRLCKQPGREIRKAQVPRRRRALLFGLANRRGSVYLLRRSERDALMPGMWELPSVAEKNGYSVLHRLKHSITNSDYQVSVLALPAELASGGRWVKCDRIPTLPVTGLTRKIWRAANLWPRDGI
jgi:A/G-specific adenine glycosylase